MNNIKTWLSGLFKDENGSPSSKRFVGIMCAIALCATMYHNSFSTVDVAPAPYLVQAVALLAFGCLGLSSADKFIATKKQIKDATEEKSEETSAE
jgi:hypothetical protein